MIKRIFAAALLSSSLSTLAPSQSWASDVPQNIKPLSAAIALTAPGLPSGWKPSLPQLERFGLRCVSNTKDAPHPMVSEVGGGSAAYRSGLKYGDSIVELKAGNGAYALTVDRDGKLYAVTLGGSVDSGALAGQLDHSTITVAVGRHPFPVLEIARVRHDGVRQSVLPNCWFEASLSAVVDTREGPTRIANMITALPSGYQVKFPGVPESVQVTENQIVSEGVADPARWAAVLEVAETEVYPDNAPARGATTGNPGVKVGLEMLTGRQVSFVRPEDLSPAQLSALLTRLRSAGLPITVASKSPGEHRQRIQPVTPNHAYSVVNFENGPGLITLRNPYGRERANGMGLVQSISPDEIRLDLQTFSTFFRFVAYPQ